MYQQKDNTGALFHSTKKGSEKAPDYSGECVINGVPMQIAGWKNTSAKGTSYLSLKFQEPREKEARKLEKQREPGEDEDIPF